MRGEYGSLGVQSNKPSITERFNFELWSDNNFNLILPLKGVLEFMSFSKIDFGPLRRCYNKAERV